MVGWQHQLNGHEFQQTLGDGEGQGSLACCSPWGCKESDRTEQLKTSSSSRGSTDYLFYSLDYSVIYHLSALRLKLK